MRINQLFESSDFSKLTEVWKSGVVQAVLAQLREVENGDLLANIIERSIAKNADSDPISLFSLLKNLIDFRSKQTDKAVVFRLQGVYTDLFNDLIAVLLKVKNPPIKSVNAKVDLNRLLPLLDAKLGIQLRLLLKKESRTAAQKKKERENELFAFVGRPTFVEMPEGSGNFKKSIEIERLVKIDPYDFASHQAVSALKLRARVQGEKSEVYSILLPKGTYKDGDELEPWLVNLIDTHKEEITN